MVILNTIKNLVSRLETRNYTELPEGIHKGLGKYLSEDETLRATLLNFRAIYRAPRWLDSNTFFNSWFILTDRRIIIARNASVFKRFRDIPLAGITQIYYELDSTEPKITINSPGHEDIIEFPKKASIHCSVLEGTLKDVIEVARKTHQQSGEGDFIFCSRCGSKILRGSHFCSECGSKLNSR